ncbi:MAG: glutamine-hydrolyzing GMP synthase, partial [Campylobacteraceae bacterium]|nr:glutamine-hydrolyzing GMP synthase [Campylobacteraceae bacterium]
MKNVPIVILDFGSQYTQLIARRMREEKVYCEIVPYNESTENIRAKNPKGLIFSGGPASVYAKDAYKIDEGIYELGLPILGICYGMQLIAHRFGGEVAAANRHEYGKASVHYENESLIFKNTQNDSVYWMSHADRVEKLPEGFVCIASSGNSTHAAIANEEKKIYALQFHPEVTHSNQGAKVLRNFAKEICGCETTWNMGSFAKEQIAKIQEITKDKKVLCAVSGGVDSSVVATLLHEAIGEQLVPIFVDTGLLRANEREQVENMFKVSLKIPLITIDASEI